MDRLVYVQIEFLPRLLVIFERELQDPVEYHLKIGQLSLVLGAMIREWRRKTVDVEPYLCGLTAYRIPQTPAEE